MKIANESMKVRVKRGREFDCFLEKFEKPWAKKKIGLNLTVDYMGEAGVDIGGPKREFFCGMYSVSYTHLTLPTIYSV